MRLLQKNRKERKTDCEQQIVHDFLRRAPYWSYRAKGYEPYDPLLHFQEDIDRHLEALFSGEIDDGNGDVLDSQISDIVRQAQTDLKRQLVEHGDVIRSFGIRASSDRCAFQAKLETLREEKTALKREIDSLIERIKDNEGMGGYRNETL